MLLRKELRYRLPIFLVMKTKIPDSLKSCGMMQGSLVSFFKTVYTSADRSQEERFIQDSLENVPRNACLVDYGCGKGRIMRQLIRLGFVNALGIDSNPRTIELLRQDGIRSYATSDYTEAIPETADVLLMIHLVEHLQAHQIIDIVNSHKNVDRIIIVTPTFINEFFDDPDHIRPYPPASLKMLLSDRNSQISKNVTQSFRLVKIRYKRSPYRVCMTRNSKLLYYLSLAGNLALAFVFLLTFRALGRNTASMTVFERANK
jgi:hypothetical protein